MLVHEVLESNQEMSQRLASIRVQSDTASSRSTAITRGKGYTDDDASTIRSWGPGYGGVLNSELRQTTAFGFAFEQDLQSSRVYRRTLKRDAESSVSSSFGRSVGWSFLSGLSLTDVSCLSVISLPISGQEIWNSSYYGPRYEQIDHVSLPFRGVEDLPSGSPRLPGLIDVVASERITGKKLLTGPTFRSFYNLSGALQRCKDCDEVLSTPVLHPSATMLDIQSHY